jgi:hypothetical protein
MVFFSVRAALLWCLLLPLAVPTVMAEGIVDAVGGKLKKWFMPPPADSLNDRRKNTPASGNVLFRFFDETFTPGGFVYVYPEESKVSIDEDNAKNGEVSLQFDLVADDYSGGAVCLYKMTYNLRPQLKKAALQFWIKGALGNENAMAAFVDEDKSDRRKTVVRVPVNWYGRITKEWSLISIPLEHFVRLNEKGVYWDKRWKDKEFPRDFDWDRVAEFRIEVRKDENKSFRVWVDDIFIVKMTR